MPKAEEEVMYISSSGEQTPIKQVETTHLINSLAKDYREIYNCKNKDEFSARLKEIDKKKNEIYRRMNDFNEKMGE